MALNTFTSALAAVCRQQPLQEKWLLAPSLRVGFQWLDAVARAGQPVLNVRLRTLPQLALGLAGPELERGGQEFLRGLEHEHLVGRLLGRLRARGLGRRNGERLHGYLAALEPSRGLIQALTRALRDLRLAGISAAGLRARGRGWVEVESKGRELELLLSSYERELRRNRLVDYPDLLRMATDRLRSDLFAVPNDVLVLAAEDEVGTQGERTRGGGPRPERGPSAWTGTCALEHRLWLAISPSRRRTLPVDRGLAAGAAEEVTDLDRLRWIGHEPAPGKPVADGTVQVVRAVGEANEVREVLRRCLEQGVPLDEVEVLHTDTAVYVPLLHEISARLVPDDTPPPVTFAEGLAVRGFRPGRLLLAWLHWVNEDYPQATLARMIQDGLLRLDDDEPEPGHSGPARRFRALPIGAGRQRYLPVIDRALRAEPPEERRGLELLRRLVTDLLDHAPSGGRREDPFDLLAAATHLLERRARCAAQLDEYSLRRLLDEIRQQARCVERWGQAGMLSMRDWLATLPDEVRVGGQGPRPGSVHVAPLSGGGHSGRRCTFIVGLDDGRFPGAGRQDPLLLDRERRALCADLPTATGRTAWELASMQRLLARLRGRVTLSYSCSSLEDDRELFPAGLLLCALRALTGDLDAEAQHLLDRLPPPASFAPDGPTRCLDPAEWWLWRLCRVGSVSDAEEVVGRHFPHLGWGLAARRARLGPVMTEYDGYVPAAGPALDPRSPDGPVLSATALETLGRCPLDFFLRYVLGLEPPRDRQVDPDVWLDPPTRGALLHHVFHDLMCQLSDSGLLPCFARDETLALGLLERHVGAVRSRQPPPSGDSFQRELAQMQQVVRIFLREEEALCRQSLPLYFEVAVGTRRTGRGTLLDTPGPAELALPGGGTVRARGSIDRVDRLPDGEGRFSVWDYKTGGSGWYLEQDPFRQGRQVQSALYLALAQARLREKVAPGARVVSFGYFFPGTREFGRRVSWSFDLLADGMGMVEELCTLMAAGCFPPSDRADELARSGFSAAIGLVEEVSAAMRTKLENPDNEVLGPLRRLREYEDGRSES